MKFSSHLVASLAMAGLLVGCGASQSGDSGSSQKQDDQASGSLQWKDGVGHLRIDLPDADGNEFANAPATEAPEDSANSGPEGFSLANGGERITKTACRAGAAHKHVDGYSFTLLASYQGENKVAAKFNSKDNCKSFDFALFNADLGETICITGNLKLKVGNAWVRAYAIDKSGKGNCFEVGNKKGAFLGFKKLVNEKDSGWVNPVE